MIKGISHAVLCIVIAMAFSLQGCVAGRCDSLSGHQLTTLKGNNFASPTMKRELQQAQSGFTVLSALTDQFTQDLGLNAGAPKIYLDRTKIRDADTRDVANFSMYLGNEMAASLSSHFQMAYSPSAADYLVEAVFQQDGSSIRISFKCRTPDGRLHNSLRYSIERVHLPEDSLKENLHSKAYKLAANIVPADEKIKLFISPLRLDSCNCVTDFSRSFTTLIRTEIVRLYPDVKVCTEKSITAGGWRGIKRKAGKVKNLETSDAGFAGADTVLEGDYFVNGETVMVNLILKDLSGRVSSTASVDIDRAMIHSRMDNPVAASLAEMADKQEETGNDVVKISSTRGSSAPVYHDGEKLFFWIQAKKPLYLYLYDITSKGQVTLLYPYTDNTSGLPSSPKALQAIPDERDDFEFKAIPPYGMDIVKVFASPVQLPVPELSIEERSLSYFRGIRVISTKRKKIQNKLSRKLSINPDDLVDYYRGQAIQFNVPVYEDSLIVETSP